MNNPNRNPQNHQANQINTFSAQSHNQININTQNNLIGNYQNKAEELNAKIKAELIDHIKLKIQGRFVEENLYQKQTTDYLENAKLHLDYRSQKLANIIDRSDYIFNDLKVELIKIQKEVDNLTDSIKEKSSKYISKDNCFEFINKDEKFDILVNILCCQATIEDILVYIKKGFERRVINFDETIRSMRLYSRELTKLKYIKDKILLRYSHTLI